MKSFTLTAGVVATTTVQITTLITMTARADGIINYQGTVIPPAPPIIPGKVVIVEYSFDTGDATSRMAVGLVAATARRENSCPSDISIRRILNNANSNIENSFRRDKGYAPIGTNIAFYPTRNEELKDYKGNDPDGMWIVRNGNALNKPHYRIQVQDAGKRLCLWPAMVNLRTPNRYIIEGPPASLLVEVPNTVQTLPPPKIWAGTTSIEQEGNAAWSDISRSELRFTVAKDSGLERTYIRPTGASLRSRKIFVFFPKFNTPLQTDSQGVYGGTYSLDLRTNLVTRNRAPFIAIGPNQNGITNSVWMFSKTVRSDGSENPFSSFGCTGEGWGCDESTNPTPKLNLATTAMLAIDSARDREPNAGSFRYAYVCAMQLVHWFSDRPSDNRFVLSKPRCARLAP